MAAETWEDEVWQAKPGLKELVDRYGDRSVLDYYLLTEPGPAPLGREVEWLFSAIAEEGKKVLGEDILERCLPDLKDAYGVSTADHHGPLCHPFFLNSNLVQGAANQLKARKSVWVLAISDISLNNSSFPRGIFYHLKGGEEVRVNFVPSKYRNHPVYGFPKVDKFRSSDKKVAELLDQTFFTGWSLAAADYGEQLSRGNYLFWRYLPGGQDSELIYLEAEKIVSRLLVRHLSEGTVISRILLSDEYRSVYSRLFDGIPGSFSKATGKGTEFFWRLNNGRRLPMLLSPNGLISSDGYVLKMNEKDISSALLGKEIIPSLCLSLTILSLHHGLDCAGGFSQIQYLSQMKQVWLKLLGLLGEENGIKTAEKVITNRFRGDMVLAALKIDGKIVPMSGVDLALGSLEMDRSILKKWASSLTLKNAVQTMLPEIYKIVTRKSAPDPEHILRSALKEIL